MNIDIQKIQSKVAQCILSECPAAAECLRQIVRQNCNPKLERITIINPDAIQPGEHGCQFFKSTEAATFGKGFRHFLEQLTVKQYGIARAVLLSHFNGRSQYSRYLNGILLISPDRHKHIAAALKSAGIDHDFVCDDYVTSI